MSAPLKLSPTAAGGVRRAGTRLGEGCRHVRQRAPQIVWGDNIVCGDTYLGVNGSNIVWGDTSTSRAFNSSLGVMTVVR